VTDVPPPKGTTAGRHLEQGLDLAGVGGAYDRVGRVAEVSGAGAQQVGRRLAAGAQPAALVVGGDVVGADDGGEVGERDGGKSGVRQPHRSRVVHPVVGHREHQLHQAAGGLRQVGGAVWVAPAGRVHLGGVTAHVLQCDT
jgi:hypothetical protein